MRKKILILPIAFSLFFVVNSTLAATIPLLNPEVGTKIKDSGQVFGNTSGYDTTASDDKTIGRLVASLVQIVLSLLGIIFFILMVYAGYNWMTAAGDEKKIEKAQHTLRTAVIGLIIIVLAYAFTWFVFAQLDSAMNSGGMTTSP